MKKTPAIILILVLVLGVRADLLFPDLTTPHTNTVSSRGYITISNAPAVYLTSVEGIINGSGVVTNLALTYATNFVNHAPYFAYNFTNISYGDSSASAWNDSSNNFRFVMVTITNAFYALFTGTNLAAGTNTFYQSFVSVGSVNQSSNTWNWQAMTNVHTYGDNWTAQSNGAPGVFLLWYSPTGAVVIGHQP